MEKLYLVRPGLNPGAADAPFLSIQSDVIAGRISIHLADCHLRRLAAGLRQRHFAAAEVLLLQMTGITAGLFCLQSITALAAKGHSLLT